MASILLNRQRGHSAPLMLCPSEGSHYAVPCSSVKSGALYNASQPGEPRRATALSLGYNDSRSLFRSALGLSADMTHYQAGTQVNHQAAQMTWQLLTPRKEEKASERFRGRSGPNPATFHPEERLLLPSVHAERRRTPTSKLLTMADVVFFTLNPSTCPSGVMHL